MAAVDMATTRVWEHCRRGLCRGRRARKLAVKPRSIAATIRAVRFGRVAISDTGAVAAQAMSPIRRSATNPVAWPRDGQLEMALAAMLTISATSAVL